MTQGPISSDTPVAVIEGPKGTVEIFEAIVHTELEYKVKFNDVTKIYNNLGEAYLEAGELAGTPT